MKPTKTTPGPWNSDGLRKIVAPGGQPIAQVFSGAVGFAQADANEACILCAPDLLESLEELLLRPADHVPIAILMRCHNVRARARGEDEPFSVHDIEHARATQQEREPA